MTSLIDTAPVATAEQPREYRIDIIRDGEFKRVALLDGDTIVECSRKFGTFEKEHLLKCLFAWRKAFSIDYLEREE